MKMSNRIKNYLYEVFRPHSGKEYAELFTRGDGKADKVPLPWLYVRVWLLFLVLFAISVFGYAISELDASTVIFLGATFGNIGLLVLLYELLPSRGLSLLTLLAVLFAGGVVSMAFSQLFYSIASYNTPYIGQLWTAFVEETSKAVTTVIVILILKKRSPYLCFLMGAAVGSGFSMFEDMWYIYTDAVSFSFTLSDAVMQGFVRSWGAPFSHAAWAAAFGWALSFEKPWKNFRPYAVFLGNYVLHFFVNFPLMPQFAGWKGYPISMATGIISIIFGIYLIFKYRAAGLAAEEKEQLIEASPPSQVAVNGERRKSYGLEENIVGMATSLLCALLVILIAFLYRGPYISRTEEFKDIQSAINYAQNGEKFTPDFEREYVTYEGEDLTDKNYSVTITEGEIVEAVQREQYGDYFYRFRYGYRIKVTETDHGENEEPTEEREWVLIAVQLEYGERICTCSTLWFENEAYRVFIINDDVLSVRVRADGTAYASVLTREYYKNELLCKVLFIADCVILVGGMGAFAILKIKSRRKNYDGQ